MNLKFFSRLFFKSLDTINYYVYRFFSLIGLGYLYWLGQTFLKLRFKIRALYKGTEKNRRERFNLYNFRRNIHRIEKGLSYATLKPVFAEDYIGETVKYLKEGEKAQAFDKESIGWGKAVLNEYFSKVNHTKTISKAFKTFEISIKQNNFPRNEIPYKEVNRPNSDITYDQLMKLSIRRRSVRHYKDLKVGEDLIKKAYEIAKLSPSACNRQSFHYYFYNQPEIVKRLSQIPGGVAGYEIPAVVVLVGNYNGYFDERDINAPIIDASLSAMSFLYALETLGLSSVCINWPNLPDREKKIRKVLNLKKHEFVIMMIGLGYPEPTGKVPYSKKRIAQEVVKVNAILK